MAGGGGDGGKNQRLCTMIAVNIRTKSLYIFKNKQTKQTSLPLKRDFMYKLGLHLGMRHPLLSADFTYQLSLDVRKEKRIEERGKYTESGGKC